MAFWPMQLIWILPTRPRSILIESKLGPSLLFYHDFRAVKCSISLEITLENRAACKCVAGGRVAGLQTFFQPCHALFGRSVSEHAFHRCLSGPAHQCIIANRMGCDQAFLNVTRLHPVCILCSPDSGIAIRL